MDREASFLRTLLPALFALLVAGGVAPLAHAADSGASSALLLVARDDLPDPNFGDAIVLVLNNLGPAPAGIILNRPTRVTVAKLFPDDARLSHVDDRLYFGGPVDVPSVSFLFRAATPPDNAVTVTDGVYLSRDPELLKKLLARDRPMDGLRIFMGYAGWGPGQLEDEIGRGDWTLKPADASAIFERRSEHPWPAEDARPEGAQRI
jgi:putative transcriptional regulator